MSASKNVRYYVDFETRSTVDLRKTNAWVYSCDDSTEVLCMAFARNDEPVELWTPGMGEGGIADLLEDLKAGAKFCAHSVQFEWSIWQNVMAARLGFPPLNVDQLEDTMAMAYALSLPGSLDGASKALGIDQQKDASGRRLMLKLSKPRRYDDGVPVWWDEPALYKELYDYCLQDVVVERDIYKRMFKLSRKERDVFKLDHEINHRGIPIDISVCEAAIKAVDDDAMRAHDEIRDLTDGKLNSGNQVQEMVTWLRGNGLPDIESVNAATVEACLKRDDLPAKARRVLEIRQTVSKSSVKKINKMLSCAGGDGRVRQTMAYQGAGTGRWVGRHIQPQNFPRPSLEQPEIEESIDLITKGNSDLVSLYYGSIGNVVSSCLRGMIKAPVGKTLMAADFSNIEGRVLAWLADEKWKLRAFEAFDADEGPDIYLVTAAGIYNVPVDSLTKKSPERQIGKVAELACGYQGGVGAFQQIASSYRVEIPDEQADEIKTAWREKHEKTTAFWYALEREAIKATKNPGRITRAGKIKFRMNGSFLFCQLPSGRALSYPYAEIVKMCVPWSDKLKDALRYKSVNSKTRQWEWTYTYGGKLAENVTQATARDLLAEAMLRIDGPLTPIIMHVHDEIVAEVDEACASLDPFCAEMRALPNWAAGCPVAVEGWVGARFRK